MEHLLDYGTTMPPQLIAALIMFAVTVFCTSMLFFPVTRFPRKNALFNFYWAGFWTFLALIASFSGAQSTLIILDQDVTRLGTAVLGALVITFVLFVVFAWLRIVLKGLTHFAQKL